MGRDFRIVSLCPSNTEILHALGLIHCVVGVDNYSDWPYAELLGVPRLGPDLHIDMQKVQDLKPDLVLASLSVPGMEHVVAQLEATKLPFLVLSPHDLNDILNDVQTVAETIAQHVDFSGHEQVVHELSARVSRVKSATQNIVNRPTVYFEWWPNPVFSPAKRNWLTGVSNVAGVTNIFEDVDDDKVQDAAQSVIARNPDYFLGVWTGVLQQKVPLQKILSRPGWQKISAFEMKRIFILPEGLYCRPSPRLIDGLEQLVSLVHPDIAASLGCSAPQTYGPVRTANGAWLGGVTPPS